MAAAVIDILFASEEKPYYSSSPEIVKELAVVDVSTYSSQQWRFADPCAENFEEYNPWLPPKIDLSGGDVPYQSLSHILKRATESYKVLFVYGKLTTDTLKKLLQRPTIYDLKEMFDINISELPFKQGSQCLHHFLGDEALLCPHANAYRLVEWCNNHWDKINMMETQCRLQTFKNWTLTSVSKEKLASTGFTHTPTKRYEDMTECVYCGLQVSNWSSEDIPSMKHRYLNRYCMIFNFCSFGSYDV